MQRAVHGVHGSLHAVCGSGADWVIVGPGGQVVLEGDSGAVAAAVAGMPDARWAWWSATDAAPVVRCAAVMRAWDVAEVHRLLAGGSKADPPRAWAHAHGLRRSGIPAPPSGDLFDLAVPVTDDMLTPDGYLNPAMSDPAWRSAHLPQLARAVLETARLQASAIAERPHGLLTAMSESGAGVLTVELERDGLPIDRARMSDLIESLAGRRPRDDNDAAQVRRVRDEEVLRHVPGVRADLRNPAQVRELLRSVGVQVDDTRAWHLEPYRHVHPVVAALLDWRKAERIATTYGWNWMDRFVGPDDRLRGPWTVCDGGAGRMTAGAGLHSLPTPLRPGVAAAPGHLFARADLGQVEPRVLAAVSGDAAFAQATLDDDLYATVAHQLGVERPRAKIAVLAAMYGQTSGTAADALQRLDRAYPTAMAYLRAAAARGEAGEDVMTYGGRRVRVRAADEQAARRAHGRFARNAVIQGAAAEFFKAWALTVRAGVRPLGGRIVLCLHDELLVHVPSEHASEAAQLVDQAVVDAARRWTGGAPVRFVADTAVIERWSQAKA